MTQIGKPRIPAGDTFKLVYDVVNEANAVMPLTGAVVIWSLSLDEEDAEPFLVKQIGEGIVVDPVVNGRFAVHLASEETALPARDYWHKAQITFLDGTVSTVNRGWLSILP